MSFPFAMLFMPALILAPTLAQAQPDAAPAGPRITFESTHFDFGKISGDAKVTHRFKVTNTGKAYLNITRANPSCGCTSTVVGKWSLAPGESSEIEATFNPKGFKGLSRKSIQVVSDDPVNPTQTLTFEAEVVREIMPSTENVYFQDVVRTTPRKASVKLESGNGKQVQITDIKTPDAPWLSASARQAGLEAWVDFQLDGRKIPPQKSFGNDVIIVRTSNPNVPSINLTVSWELRAAIVADPVRVAWVESAGQTRSTTVTLKQVDGKPFRILSARSSNTLITVEQADHGSAPTHRIQVVMAAKAKPASYMEKVILTLDDPDQPELELRVSASLR